MKKHNSLEKFESFAINKATMKAQKGGLFKEIYVCYTQVKCIEIDPCVMQAARKLDKTLKECGWWAAMQQASGFLAHYRH